MASKTDMKKEEVANGACPSNAAAAAGEPATNIEATQARLLKLTRELTNLTQEVMDSDPVISKIPKLEIVKILNPLIKIGKLKIHLDENHKPYLKLGTVLRAFANATPEEKLLLHIIEEASSKGIWIKEMRTKSGLTQLELTKVLKSMESKKMIKSVTSVKVSKKKMFLLYDVTPDSSLTGGPSWPNGKFDGTGNDIDESSAGGQPSKRYKMTESLITLNKKLLLQVIGEAGSKGIWTKEMWTKVELSGLTQLEVTKILKMMESKKMIKSVTLEQVSKKKMFVLYDVTTDSPVTGGN